jgi:hypothetical protein
MTRHTRQLLGFVLSTACASAPVATTTRSLPGTKVFSGTSQTGGSAATPWTRTDIYAHTSATDSQYVGTTVHYEAPITTSVTGVRTIELAMSADGRSIVFLHDARMAPRDAGLTTGVYRYTVGEGRQPVHLSNSGQRPARWDWLSGRPKPFPADLLPIGSDTVFGVRPNGESFPLILLDATTLHRAAFAGRTDETASLVQQGTNPNALTAWGETPLGLAIIGRHPETALRLITLGADVRAALPLAVYYGQPDVVDPLLTRGADVNFVDRDGNTPLHLAVLAALGGVQSGFFGEVESPVALMRRNVSAKLVSRLVAAGANPKAVDRNNKTARDLLGEWLSASGNVALSPENAAYNRYIAEIQRILDERMKAAP